MSLVGKRAVPPCLQATYQVKFGGLPQNSANLITWKTEPRGVVMLVPFSRVDLSRLAIDTNFILHLQELSSKGCSFSYSQHSPLFNLRIPSFLFPSLPETESWLLFIVYFLILNVQICVQHFFFLADWLCSREKRNSQLRLVPKYHTLPQLFELMFADFLLLIFPLSCVMHRKSSRWGRKVSRDILFFQFLDVSFNEWYF